MDHAIEHSHNGSSGYEAREANVKLIVLSAAGLAVTVVIVFILMLGTFNLLKDTDEELRQKSMSPLAEGSQVPPEPRLEEHPWEQLQQLHAREDKILHSYGWQDQKDGIVRVPIDRAMELALQKGFPVQQPGQAPPVAKAAPQTPVKPVAPGVPNAK